MHECIHLVVVSYRIQMSKVEDRTLNSVDVSVGGHTLLFQGAEARVWESTFLGLPAVVKQRFKKGYRHPKLDQQITSSRLKQEVRSMLRARKLGVQTPTIYAVDEITSCICMQRVDGVSLKELLLRSHADHEGSNALGLVQDLGSLIAKLHDGGVVHGDLTTSNALVVAHQKEGTMEENGNPRHATQHTIFLIDFGLSYFSNLAEDRAVDLYVLERAFVSAHALHGEHLFQTLLDSYRRTSRAWSSTFNKFSEVRMRGRKRSMVG